MHYSLYGELYFCHNKFGFDFHTAKQHLSLKDIEYMEKDLCPCVTYCTCSIAFYGDGIDY